MSAVAVHLEKERGIPLCWYVDAQARGYTQAELDDIDVLLTHEPEDLPVTKHSYRVNCVACTEWIHG